MVAGTFLVVDEQVVAGTFFVVESGGMVAGTFRVVEEQVVARTITFYIDVKASAGISFIT